MRASIAIAAAVVGVAQAVPGYGYGEYEPSSTPAYTPEPYPSSTPVEYPVYSTGAPVYSSSVEYPVYSSSAVEYPVYSSSTPVEYPVYSTSAAEYPVYSSSAVEYPSGYVTKTVYATSTYEVSTSESVYYYTTVIPAYTTVCPEEYTPIYTPIVYESSSAVPYVPEESSIPCSTSTTVTVTLPYTTEVPYYPTGSSAAPYYPTGTGAPTYPVGTASSSGSYVKPSAPPQFTGAASHAQVGGFVAGVGALAALFL
ncbi:hypothetical protein P154DRAFT_521531 [Amniculicola lignicola CBS 123094]|uniref:Uncharacterized protein n=1 Tax=Amniculicola lignicola CBS 123094 TaxID=1392246 RepID=A0A6A5WLZ0_9PLEO|nr:hypothetical protein P154DRAFT_521531 [Amniculicola lignicola CBS 123094]